MPEPAAVSREEFNLYNPALIAAVIEESARGHRKSAGTGITLPLVYAASTIGLFGHLRADLPGTTRTHLATWMTRHPEFHPEFQRLLKGGMPALRAGLLFGLGHNALDLDGSTITARGRRRGLPDGLSVETREILAASGFVGRWLGKTGNPSTSLSLLGFTS